MEEEKKYVVKSSENKYWRKSFPDWTNNINNVTPLTFEDAQNVVDKLETEVDFLLSILPLDEEYKKYRIEHY